MRSWVEITEDPREASLNGQSYPRKITTAGRTEFAKFSGARNWTSDEFVALSKEVASHYQPLVARLLEAGIIMINVIPQCAVFEAETVMPAHKSYFNEGKILLFGDLDERINSEKNGKLKPKFKPQYGKFVAPQIPWSGTIQDWMYS
jgi:hypothetical protein